MPTDHDIATHVAKGGIPKAGYCTDCGEIIWRSVVHPRDGRVILWPDPTTVYARIWVIHDRLLHAQERATKPPDRWAHASVAVGAAFCADCCPALGADALPGIRVPVWTDASRTAQVNLECTVIVGHDTAADRYRYWFTPAYGDWLRAWLQQEIGMMEPDVEAMMAQWRADVAQVNRPG